MDNNSKQNKLASTTSEEQMPLSKGNFVGMIISGAMIIIGFLLMLGNSSGEEFNADIFSTRRIVVGPAIAFLGFVFMAIAIIVDPARFNHLKSKKK